MEAKRICPYCMGELESRVSVCPHLSLIHI